MLAALPCGLRGLFFRTVGLGVQLGLLGLIIGSRADAKWSRLLAGGYAVARGCLSCTHAIVAATIPRARRLSVVNACAGFVLAGTASVLAMWQGREEGHRAHIRILAAVAAGEW